MNWKICALLSAFFASMTAIFAKLGVKGVDSNLATAIRVTVILVFAWGVSLGTGVTGQLVILLHRSVPQEGSLFIHRLHGLHRLGNFHRLINGLEEDFLRQGGKPVGIGLGGKYSNFLRYFLKNSFG